MGKSSSVMDKGRAAMDKAARNMLRFFKRPGCVLRFFKQPGYVGWFGKLPSAGDFAGTGMTPILKETVHEWMSSGMAALRQSHPTDWQAAYLVSPVWHFLVGPGIWDKPALIGCLAPSVDKVGRYSPLIVLRSFDRCDLPSVLPPESRWLYRVDMVMRRVIGERISISGLHDLLQQLTEAEEESGRNSTSNILCDLGIGNTNANVDASAQKDWFVWPELPELLEQRSYSSFWWSEPSSVQGMKQIVHNGVPNENLFCLLMDGGVSNE